VQDIEDIYLAGVLVEVQAATINLCMTTSLRAYPRWSSSGHDKSIYGREFAGRLDFNQHTEGGIAPLCPANMIATYCLKSKAPSSLICITDSLRTYYGLSP